MKVIEKPEYDGDLRSGTSSGATAKIEANNTTKNTVVAR